MPESNLTNLIERLELLGLLTDLEAIGELAPSMKGKRPKHFSPEYLAYLNSPHWQARRERLSPNKRCGGCNTIEGLQLHHRCYPAKGSPLQAFIDQSDDEFTWLCPTCHKHIGKAMQEIRQRRNSKRQKRKKT